LDEEAKRAKNNKKGKKELFAISAALCPFCFLFQSAFLPFHVSADNLEISSQTNSTKTEGGLNC
jgi:hypothetical protein